MIAFIFGGIFGFMAGYIVGARDVKAVLVKLEELIAEIRTKLKI